MMLLPLAVLLTVADGPAGAPTPSAAAAENVDFARQRYQRGLTLYDQQQFEEALAEFQASTALYASPNSHLFAARCLRALGRVAEAVVQYERSIGLAQDRASTDPRYQATRDAAREELRVLEPQVGRLALNARGLPARARVLVGEREIPPGALGLSVPVNPGQVRVVVLVPGEPAFSRTLSVASGELVTVSLPSWTPTPATAPPPPPSAVSPAPSPLRPWAWISLGVGAAGLSSFGAFYILADREYRALDDRCRPSCPTPPTDAVARGRLYQRLTNVSLAVGAAGLVAGVALWSVSLPPAAESMALVVSAAPSGIAIGGAF